MINFEKNLQESNDEDVKQKVVVWLDFDAYAYITFGIITELSKIGDFDFIGIVTTKQDMEFFQKQKIVKFKELFYYPDCYINNNSYNIENLKRFEDEYELDLWLDLYTERSFYKYWVDFYQFSKEEIFSITENTLKFIEDIFKKNNPKLVLMQFVGENISNLLLYRIAKKMNIRIMMPHVSYIQDKIIMTDNFTGNEILNEYQKNLVNMKDDSEKYSEQFIKKNYVSKTFDIILDYNYKPTFFQKIKHIIKRLNSEPEPIYKNFGKSKFKMLKYRVINYFRIRNREKFLDKNTIKKIKNEKFIYFPLSTEPESYKLITTPFLSNQLVLVENIAKSIPGEMILYVKEHPVQKMKSWRSINDYKKFMNIPNVKFIHPSVNSQELISKSQAVITAGGATGFETLFHKKPVIIFSDEHYEKLDMVTKISNFSDLSKKIKTSLKNFTYKNNQINALMKAYEKQCISVPLASITKDGISLSAIQRYENNFEMTLANFEKFCSSYQKFFRLMAEKCI